MQRVALAGCILFGLLLMIYGGQHMLNVKGFGQVSSALRMPMWIVYACLPLGGLWFLLRSIEAMVRTFFPQSDKSSVD